MTWLWPEGDPIRVEADRRGAPRAFVWQGRRHEVARILRRFRYDDRWWHRRVWREYFKLTTRDNLLVVIYHVLPGGAWRLERLYD